MESVAFLGLGVMGRPMSACLLKAGYKVYGFDVNPAFTAEMAKQGLIPAATVAEAVREADYVITTLPTQTICREVCLGPEGIAENARPGVLVLEMSTTSPGTAKELGAGFVKKGMSMMDAPVSGGPSKAATGELAIMAGGTEADFARALPLFKAMGATVKYVGEVGAGNTIKMANQIMGAVNMAGVAEAFALVAKAGFDPALVYEAVEGGLADSVALRIKGRMMLDRNFEPGARIHIHMKDMVTVMEEAHKMHFPAPLAALVTEMMQSLTAMGMGDWDQSSFLRYYEITGGVDAASVSGKK